MEGAGGVREAGEESAGSGSSKRWEAGEKCETLIFIQQCVTIFSKKES